jgi:hypothetical protein
MKMVAHGQIYPTVPTNRPLTDGEDQRRGSGVWVADGSGAQVAQAADDSGKRLGKCLDVSLGGRPPDGQAQRVFAIHAHGLEHRRRCE